MSLSKISVIRQTKMNYVNLPFVLKVFQYLLRCRHGKETKELHVLSVADVTHVKMDQKIVKSGEFRSVQTLIWLFIAARK